ncbi:MAG TPA: alpha/beta fold hydrolase [Candidatus Nanoarchaeia archaeon]|nr:alpha/beta fold hydrolase [Candidatus Nanoarchaeia archaeon]
MEEIANGIFKEDISYGRVYGTAYFKKELSSSKGILLVPGFSRNRYSMSALAQALAENGYFCLSIDPPSHFLNFNKFTIGELSESIHDSIYVMQSKYKIKKIALLGHSMGAIGVLFSVAGYNSSIEKNIYEIWDRMLMLLDKQSYIIKNYPSQLNAIIKILDELEECYNEIKKMILDSIKKCIGQINPVQCCILLAPPLDPARAIPAIGILKKLNEDKARRIFEYLIHRPAVKRIYKDGNPVGYIPDENPEYLKWQFFKTKGAHEFLDYFLHIQTPLDYLKLIEDISKMRNKDDKINFLQYYHKKYLVFKPKIFIYGMKDLFLRPFMPFAKKRLENYYESCGNAEIHHGSFSHIMKQNPNQQLAAIAIDNETVILWVSDFLKRNLK